MFQQPLTEQPDFLALMAGDSGFFPALLESQSYNDKIGRYDILFAAPASIQVAYDPKQLACIMRLIDGEPNQTAARWPFAYGWFVYFAYEAGLCFEPSLQSLFTTMKEPLAVAIYCQGAIIRDCTTDECVITAHNELALAEITHQVSANRKPDRSRLGWVDDAVFGDWQVTPAEQFETAVSQAKAWIEAGHIYQANLSRQWSIQAESSINPMAMMQRLRQTNPAPFAGVMSLPDFAVVSSSPERLLCLQGGWVETRPIAGTRPRGEAVEADLALQRELLETTKERAEHVMLIDLERNDVGRVSAVGSVSVDELMVIESYEHVHHIVSNVKGRVRPGVGIADVIRALFPGGTITGCPKIRCMELIHQIEAKHRGCYTGSMGYVNHDGQVDLNILIRSMVIQGAELRFHAGAGIVADSVPAAESLETEHKAKGLIKAVAQS